MKAVLLAAGVGRRGPDEFDLAVAARNLTLAEEQALDVITNCSGCTAAPSRLSPAATLDAILRQTLPISRSKASAMSAVVMEPKRRPFSLALASKSRVTSLRRCKRASARASICSSRRASAARRRASTRRTTGLSGATSSINSLVGHSRVVNISCSQ